MDDNLVSLLANSVSFQYRDGICRRFDDDVIIDMWFQLPVYVIGRVSGGYMHCEFSDGDSLTAEDGDVYVIGANRQHRYRLINQGSMEIINAHVNYFLFDTVDLLQLTGFTPVIKNGARADEVEDTCRRLIDLRQQHALSLADIVRRQQMAFHLFLLVHGESNSETTIERVSKAASIQPVLEYIERNYRQPLTRRDLARRLHLSEPRFHVVFKEATGMAPLNYVKHLRLSKAQQLLLQGNRSVAEVSDAVGYQDPFHFSRLFKAEFGVSPQKYRRAGRLSIM